MRAAKVATVGVEFTFSGDEGPLWTRRPDGVATIVLDRWLVQALEPELKKGSPMIIGGFKYKPKSWSTNAQTGARSYVLEALVDKLP